MALTAEQQAAFNRLLAQMGGVGATKFPVSVDDPVDASQFSDVDTIASKIFTCSTNDISSGTGGAESAQVLIKNPAASGKRLLLFKLVLGTNVSTNNNIFRLYKAPTITSNGTSLIIVNLYQTASPVASVMEVYKTPTASSNGTFFNNYCVGPTSSLMIYFEKIMVIDPGQSLLINVRPNTNGVTYHCNPFWIEKAI